MKIFLKKLNFILDGRDKRYLAVLFVLTIVTSCIETIGISAIMPFVSMLSNPQIIITQHYYRAVYSFFGFDSTNDFIMAFAFVLMGFYIFRGTYTIFYNYLQNRFSFGRYAKFALQLFQNYTTLPYQEFTKRNTANLLKNIITEASHMGIILQSGLILVSELLTTVLLYLMLLFVNWKMTLVLTVILGLKVLFLVKAISRIVKKQGEKRSEFSVRLHRLINETFGNIKVIKLLSMEEKLFKEFGAMANGFARTNIISTTLAQLPRNILETVGFSLLIGVIIFVLYIYNDALFIVPLISMYALALFRMLPAMNRILTSYSHLLFFSYSLDLVHEDLLYKSEEEKSEPVSFNHSIILKDIAFSYNGTKNVLSGVSLTINKMDRIAIIGESGSGKTTLIDLIIGLYRPRAGMVTVDGAQLNANNIKSWRKKFGYIPQSVYLFDGTVADNVAFGAEYDENKIIEMLKKANIYTFLMAKEGIHTMVGEGGIQLSGGQKQRVGIARALYRDPDILVMDEATSALDQETEAKIMDDLYESSADRTLLVVAHRLSTIQKCHRKFKLENGKIIEVC